MFTVTLVGDTAIIARLKAWPLKVHERLLSTVTRLALLLQAHVQRDKLQGQVLRHVTGKLSASIEEAVVDEPNSVLGRVFSNGTVKYAAIHEFGGTIPAHDVFPVAAGALHFFMGGQEVFARSAHIPDVHMPERSFLRSALADLAAQIERELTNAAAEAWGAAP